MDLPEDLLIEPEDDEEMADPRLSHASESLRRAIASKHGPVQRAFARRAYMSIAEYLGE